MRYEIHESDAITIDGRNDRGIVTGNVDVYRGHPGSYYEPAEGPDIESVNLTYADGTRVDCDDLTDEQYEILREALLMAAYERQVEEAAIRLAAEEDRLDEDL